MAATWWSVFARCCVRQLRYDANHLMTTLRGRRMSAAVEAACRGRRCRTLPTGRVVTAEQDCCSRVPEECHQRPSARRSQSSDGHDTPTGGPGAGHYLSDKWSAAVRQAVPAASTDRLVIGRDIGRVKVCFLQQWRTVARFEAGRHSAMLEAAVNNWHRNGDKMSAFARSAVDRRKVRHCDSPADEDLFRVVIRTALFIGSAVAVVLLSV